MLVAFLIAFAEFFLRLNQVIYAPFYALFLIGPAAMAIHLYLGKTRKENTAPMPTTEPAVAVVVKK